MHKSKLIENTISFVKEKLENAETGHDWFHIERVYKLATAISAKENCDILVVQLAALLHDIADPKFHEGDENLAIELTTDFLKDQNVSQKLIEKVNFIIQHLSYKNRDLFPNNPPIELQIVQDADRLDAMGAIGIARTFNFGGFKNNVMYDPNIPPNPNQSKEEYKKSQGTTINHFYEKLLFLKQGMHTATAKKIAARRHQFMLLFLDEFYQEWEGN